MRFVPSDIGGSKLAVYMDLEGIVLPIPTEISTQHGIEYLDTEEKKEEYYNINITPFCYFNVDTYNTLSTSDPLSWGVVFKNVNKFLKSLTPNECMAVAMVYISMNKELKHMTSYNLMDTVDRVSNYLVALDKEISLADKLRAFTAKNMPLPNLDNAGDKPHHTNEMTFHGEHMVELTTITLMEKMLTPIFGQFFYQYKNGISVDNAIKEVHCSAILTGIFNRQFKPLILKLNNFIANTVAQFYKKKDDIIAAYGGNTEESQCLSSSAIIHTRKSITVDLDKPEGNLMTYITVCVNNSIDTQYKSPISKKIRERKANGLKDITTDEGNASRIETESVATSKTADVPIIAQWTVKHIVKLYKSVLEISEDEFQEAMAYYRMNIPSITPLTNYLLCTYFGRSIGGALNISMLQAMSYTELLVILQFIMIKRGYYGLLNSITITTRNKSKQSFTDMDNRVRMSWNSSYSFTNLKRRFDTEIGSSCCGNKMKEIIEFLTANVHAFNTAPIFWDKMDLENGNGYQYECTPDVMDTLCELIITAIDTQYGYNKGV